MLDIWSGFTGKLGEQWAASLFTPAFAFWAGGFVAWAASDHWLWVERWSHESASALIALVLAALVLVAVSGAVARRLALPLLRLLEGYWPPWLNPLRHQLICRRAKRRERDERAYQRLAAASEQAEPGAWLPLADIDIRLRLIPERVEDRMPTRLGDILRSAETWPGDKYGLDAPKCWSRLWLVLPDTARNELSAARADLDQGAVTWLFGAAFLVWIPWTWWALLVGVAVPAGAYLWMLSAARSYGELIEAAFDIHRAALYRAAGFRPPLATRSEVEAGQALTAYFWLGKSASGPLRPLDNSGPQPRRTLPYGLIRLTDNQERDSLFLSTSAES
jgi:hypothetical protein